MNAHAIWKRTSLIAAFTATASACINYGPTRIDHVMPGYEVTVQAMAPRPGTRFRQGEIAHFTVTASYRLAQTDSGNVVLVLQDEHGRPLDRGGVQAQRRVGRGSGVVTIADSLIVPAGIREVQLFTLMAPDDAREIWGQMVVHYPVGNP